MSYAIIRNEKLTRAESYGAYVHNDRKAKNHSNKDIDPTRTHLNFYCKLFYLVFHILNKILTNSRNTYSISHNNVQTNL